MLTRTGPSSLPVSSVTIRWDCPSREPKGLLPLQTFCARPSQKLRKLNTASTALGVFRPVVLRVFRRLLASAGSGNEKTGSGVDWSISTLVRFPGAVPTTPLEEPLPPPLVLPLLLILGFGGVCGERAPGPNSLVGVRSVSWLSSSPSSLFIAWPPPLLLPV